MIMSSQEQALVSLLSQLALSFDGAGLGLTLAYAAVRSILKFSANNTAIRKLHDAPSLSVSDLRSLLADTVSDADENSDDGIIVIVRGTVDAKSAVEGSWKTLRPSVLVSHESGDKGVILQRTQTCIYNEWNGLFGWSSDLRGIFGRTWRQQESTSLRKVPFVLTDDGRRSNTEYVVVNLDGSRHPLPLTTVYHKLEPITTSYTFLQAFFWRQYPIGLLDEEKILPLGKDISAVGLCRLRDGIAEIKSCKDLPYFLSELSKDQMIVDLSFKTKTLFWSGILLGSVSVGILGYAIVRNWNRWKQWQQQRQLRQQQRQTISGDVDPQPDDEIEDVPDGQLCVICLMRRRRSVFIPCGHLVCCHGCAISVENEVAPKCPVCRQEIRNSVRIFES